MLHDRFVPAPVRLIYSRKNAAKALDVSLKTVDNMVARGELELVRLTSRKVGITAKSLLARAGGDR
jgi:transposase